MPDLERNTRTVAGMTLVSRVFGLARDLVLVRIFADTPVGSAFNAAFALPNLFRRLFGEGALSAAFIPRYTQLHESDPERSAKYASLVIAALVALTGIHPTPQQVNLADDPAHAEKLKEMQALLLAEMRRLEDPWRLWNQPDDGLTPPNPRARNANRRRKAAGKTSAGNE